MARTKESTKKAILLFLKKDTLRYYSIKEMCKGLKLTRGAVASSVYDLERNEFITGESFQCFKATAERRYKLSSLITHTFLNK